RDEETGFTYHGARYYASWLGRWTSCDLAEASETWNRYEYVLGNPIKRFDPNGKWGVEMHFAAVYWSGRMAGATHAQALLVAIASQSLDDFKSTEAPHLKIQSLQRQYLQPLITGPATQLGPASVSTAGVLDQNTRAMRFGNVAHALGAPSRDIAELAAKRGIQTKNLVTFGLGLHPAGDFLPHANLSGDPSFGHQIGKNEDLSPSHWLAHDADYTFRNPMKALSTFVRFTELWSEFLGKEKPKFGKPTLEKLSKFIFSGDKEPNWGEMTSALKGGLEQAGVESKHIDEVLALLGNPERRRQIYLQLRGTEAGQTGEGEAFRIWLAVPYEKPMSEKKVDITPYLTGLPSIPIDPRFEERKERNQRNQ
ncbi:MAG: RHS repeat-associated core domain-containing protein, partial [Nitrososphaera sp.]|nr:RHS repeat-associated core domain-containing protein [Nitrososphaera sp.]